MRSPLIYVARRGPRLHRLTSVWLAGLVDNCDKAEAALRGKLERIQREPISDEELCAARAYLLGNLAMDRRTNVRQVWYLGSLEEARVGPEYLDRHTAQVRAVIAADGLRA